jgi:hypothetical protein
LSKAALALECAWIAVAEYKSVWRLPTLLSRGTVWG